MTNYVIFLRVETCSNPPPPPSLPSVPFREAPAKPTRRQQAPRSTLAAPRSMLLRSNSDNNLNVNNWSPLPSPSHSPLHSLSPRRPQQQQMPSPNGTVRTMGKGAPRPPRSRSPSLGRLGEETPRQIPQRQPRLVTNQNLNYTLSLEGPQHLLWVPKTEIMAFFYGGP